MLANTFDKVVNAQLFDDFFEFSAVRWTDTNDGATGAVAPLQTAGASGGWLSLATVGTANDYHTISSNKVVEFLPKLPVKAEIRFKITEGAANSSHWWFGLTDTVTAGGLTATTGLPPTNYHGAIFYKPAGSNSLFVQSSNGAAQVAGVSVGTFVSGSTYVLTVELDPGDGTTGQAKFFVNGQPDQAGAFVAIKPQSLALAGFAPMAVGFGVMASGANAETMLVDSVGVELYRN